MAKRKNMSIEGAMVGLDLGTRLINVNMTKVRKDETIPPKNLELIFSCQKSENCRKSKPAPLPIPRRRSHPHQLLSQNPQCHYASRERQLPSLQHLIRQRTCSSRTSHPFLNNHVLEIFAGSARFSQCCALTGLKVGTPVDIRAGFDVMTSKGRHMVMEIIKEQAPDVILMAPVCGPWSNMQKPTKLKTLKRPRYGI